MRSWLSRLLPRRVLPGTGPVTTTLGTRSGDNNLWESMTSTAGKPPRAPRPPHIPGDIYQWASHSAQHAPRPWATIKAPYDRAAHVVRQEDGARGSPCPRDHLAGYVSIMVW